MRVKVQQVTPYLQCCAMKAITVMLALLLLKKLQIRLVCVMRCMRLAWRGLC